jgi:DNA-binding GntR family transcriptional regulator
MPSRDEFLKVDRNTKTLRQICLEKMREAILNFYFAPGDRLIERKLCEELDVSRTVVREVLRHLESEGLVEIIPHKGPIVARIDKKKASQIYELRASLETIGARACSQHASESDLAKLGVHLSAIETAFANANIGDVLQATTQFYKTMFTGGSKTVAWAIIQQLNARINALRGMTFMSEGRAEDSINEMRDILAAIQERNPDKAEEACVTHVRKAYQVAQTLLDSTDTDLARHRD